VWTEGVSAERRERGGEKTGIERAVVRREENTVSGDVGEEERRGEGGA
jgi:hypothetical protein